MKKNYSFSHQLIVGIILSVVMFMLVGCGQEKKELVKLIVRSTEDNKMSYMTVDENEREKEMEKFTITNNEVYFGAYENFTSEIKGNKVVNILKTKKLTDEKGDPFTADDTMVKIMEEAANSIEHQINDFKIIKESDKYFVVVNLNVNLHTPCELYYYDTQNDTLKKIYSDSNIDILRIESLI